MFRQKCMRKKTQYYYTLISTQYRPHVCKIVFFRPCLVPKIFSKCKSDYKTMVAYTFNKACSAKLKA